MIRSYPPWPFAALLALAVAFQNFWMWPDRGLVWGLPVNLAYHVGLCAVATVLLAAVVRWAWPGDPEGDD